MSLRKLTGADFLRTPWKNGLGETVEILRASRPGGEGGFDFDWRISVAPVNADGPFSTFPGIVRTITVVEGQGMQLAFDDGERHTLLPFEPFSYDGGRQINGRLIDGAVRDFNVMVRRGRWNAEFALPQSGIEVSTRQDRPDLAVVYVLSGQWRAEGSHHAHALSPGEALVLDGGEAVELRQMARGRLALARIFPADSAEAISS